MKNILIFFVLILCLGCSNVDKEITNAYKEITNAYKEKYNVNDVTAVKSINITTANDVHLVEIEGHQYIIYDGLYKGGIIHAEHCPCKNTNN